MSLPHWNRILQLCWTNERNKEKGNPRRSSLQERSKHSVVRSENAKEERAAYVYSCKCLTWSHGSWTRYQGGSPRSHTVLREASQRYPPRLQTSRMPDLSGKRHWGLAKWKRSEILSSRCSQPISCQLWTLPWKFNSWAKEIISQARPVYTWFINSTHSALSLPAVPDTVLPTRGCAKGQVGAYPGINVIHPNRIKCPAWAFPKKKSNAV